MESRIGNLLLLFLLAGAAYEDCKERKIRMECILAGAAAGVVWNMIFAERTFADILLGMLLGAMLLLFTVLSRGAIGEGDGLLLLVSALYLQSKEVTALLMMALLLASVVSLFFILIRRKERSYRLPFAPFLLASYLFLLL